MPRHQNSPNESAPPDAPATWEEEDRRAAMRDTLPGLLYGIFVIGLVLLGLGWFVLTGLRSG